MLSLRLSSSTTRGFRPVILGQRAFSASRSLAAPLQGTAPPHRFLVFLHNPKPPSAYPAKFSTSVQRALGIQLVRQGGLVNHAWSPDQPLSPGTRIDDSNSSSEETYAATAFTPNGRVDIPELSVANAEEWANKLLSGSALPPTPTSEDTVYLYVCTHGSRDCRCGDTGGKVVEALREEVEKRGLKRQVKIAETAHVGGHKYAANVLVYPHGEWLGNILPESVTGVLDAILEMPSLADGGSPTPLCPDHWRGRMGLNKEEQLEMYDSHMALRDDWKSSLVGQAIRDATTGIL